MQDTSAWSKKKQKKNYVMDLKRKFLKGIMNEIVIERRISFYTMKAK